MRIIYGTKKLRSCHESLDRAKRAWGEKVAEKYQMAVSILTQARDIAAVRTFRSLALHKLTGDRAGQYAIRLDRRWRLIVTFHEDEEGTVTLEEVSKHYE
jgi:plasmid maintenance system killer protein